MPIGRTTSHAFHLAGIVPVGGAKLDFNMPWHDSMMPVAKNFLAVERAVEECAQAGCETIWIICHKEMQPLLRHRLGDWVIDPASLWRHKFIRFATEEQIEIPIYYIPIHPKDRDRRDCLSWSVLYGIQRAYHISMLLSKWVAPRKYYISFPYGIYPVKDVYFSRSKISSDKVFYLSHKGKTVVDGKFLGFTIDAVGFAAFRRGLRAKGTGQWENAFWSEEDRTLKGDKIPLERRWSARHFSLTDVFGSAMIEEGNILEIEDYYDLSNWEGYCEYIGSDFRKSVKRPHNFKYHEFNKIGHDEDKVGREEEEEE